MPSRWNPLTDPLPFGLIADEPLPDPTEADREAFWSDARERSIQLWRAFLLLSGVATLVSWPTDLVCLPPEARGPLGAARAIAAFLTLSLGLTVLRFDVLRRHALGWMVACGSLILFTYGWKVGDVSGLDTPLFHLSYGLLLSPAAVTLRPRARVFTAILFAGALLVGFFGLHPAHRDDPYRWMALNFAAFMSVVAIVAGVLIDRIRWRAFALWRSTARQAAELRSLHTLLEERLESRTADVRRLAEHLESARDDGRTRLARDLHDELGQELTAINYALQLTRRRYATEPATVGPNLANLESLLQRARHATHTVLAELRPRALDDRGLVHAVGTLLDRTERGGLRIDADLPTELPPLGTEVATAAFRILQESLTNVTRHARASAVRVRLAIDDAKISLEVIDDGAGLDPSGRSGFGIIGMRERAASLGGTLEVGPTADGGTRVAARLPLGTQETT